MTELTVFLGGEGRHELGGLVREAPYADPSTPGVVEACCDARRQRVGA
jgi:hypothetical protein